MIDLKREFRTLKLLSSALLIIGAGLALGGFGIGLVTRDTSKKPVVVAPAEEPDPGVEKPAEPPPPPRAPKEVKLTTYASTISLSTGLLGVVFILLGGGLRLIIRNTIDDDDDVQMSDELFKAYADQLVLAERQKQKDRKRLGK